MTVECPACGQRMEVLARLTPCPNCGQLVSATFQPPLPPRPQPASLTSPEEVRRAERPPVYRPPEPVERPHNWLPATLIILGVFIGIFFIAYLAMLKVSSYAVQPPPPPPPAPKPAPAPPPPADDDKQSKLFSFNDQTSPSKPTPPADITTAPAVPTRPVDPLMEPAPKPASASAPATKPAAPLAFAVVPAAAPAAESVTDERINDAILKAVNYLVSRFDEKYKLKADRGGHTAGAHALATLALLHASQAISDERLNIHNPFMIGLLDQLKKYEIPDTPPATYTRSLRAQALAFHYRTEDRAVLASDTRWLINSSVQGAYGYGPPTAGATQPSQTYWDNSNSQYGVLGVWAAADAGLAVPGSYWTGVQSHWERTQLSSGGWAYGDGNGQGEGTLSMTAAGVNMLFVANEQLSALRPDTQLARPPFSPSLQLGLDWLAKGDNAVTLGGGFPWYTLYGMERAGLASGFKMFGRHDWFRDLAADTLKKQGNQGEWGDEVDTAFALLFLARGRHPLLMNKLHFVGAWANRPRDVANLAKFVSKETERPLNFQVVSLKSEWSDWMDCPILYLSSHEPPIFDESDFAKLKAFVMAGGLLFTHADGGTREFNQFAEMLAYKLFDQDLKDLPPDHFVYNALFKPSEPFPLRGVGNATRTFMIHSPTDISKRWVAKGASTDRAVYELGANLFVYSTGMQVPRNRLDTVFVADLPGKPTTIVPIARLKYTGDWDPEPWAWERERRMFRRETSIGLVPFPVEIEKLSPSTAPLAHLSGTVAITLTPPQIKALHDYVAAGGVLLIDACGGSKPFAASVHAALFPAADAQPTPLKPDHPVLAGRGPGMTPLLKPQVRPFVFKAIGSKVPPITALNVGKGVVVMSDLDLTSGLLGTNTLGIIGYDPAYAHAFVRNTILWTINGRGPVTPWNDPPPAGSTTTPATTTAAAP